MRGLPPHRGTTVAEGPWPGNATSDVLAVTEAPRQDVFAAMLDSVRRLRIGARDPGGGPRTLPYFDRRGFPMDGKHRAARRALIRQRALTTTVVAAVVAAPALALWAAYRHAPQTGEAQGVNPVSASDLAGADTYAYDKARDSGAVAPARRGHGSGAMRAAPAPAATTPAADRKAHPAASGSAAPSASTTAGAPKAAEPGRIKVTAVQQGTMTLLTIAGEGGSPVRWTASTTASWLRFSIGSGEVRPGESVTVTVTVDHASEPPGPWHARVVFGSSGQATTIEGQGPTAPPTLPADPTPPPAPRAF